MITENKYRTATKSALYEDICVETECENVDCILAEVESIFL